MKVKQGIHHIGVFFRSGAYYIIDVFVALVHAIRKDMVIIQHAPTLFLGVALTIYGLLSFKSDRYCDGNLADYYSCTRPSTYYYYDGTSITFAILGVFLVIIWVLGKTYHERKQTGV